MSAPRRLSHLRIVAVVLAGVALAAVVWPAFATAEIPAVAQRQRAEKKTFTDSEIIDGFLKTAFGAEYHLAGRVDRIRKYQTPVRVFADGNRSDRQAGSASRHRDGRRQRRRQCPGQAGARPRSQSHHLDLLRQRAGARDSRLA